MSFRREKHVPRGGPDGGDGGRGGSVVLAADAQLTSLGGYRDRRRFRAQNGRPGAGALKAGRDGADLVLRVPPGTVVRDGSSGEQLADLVTPGDRIVVAAGGRGGRGNARFTSATHQAPRIGELGAPGDRRRVELELQLIADIGLVGLPNAGKSTLLGALTGAHPRVADYPFTTLSPNLGVAEIEGGRAVVVADVPGLIEGASRGVGLGIDFLRHLARTRVLLHLVDASGGPPAALEAARVVGAELDAFSPSLAARRRLTVLTKLDLPAARAAAPAVAAALEAAVGGPVMAVSAATGEGCGPLLASAGRCVVEARAAEAAPGSRPAAGPTHRVYRHSGHAGVRPAISREQSAFRVSGAEVERLVAMTDLDSEEAVARLQRRLRAAGVDAGLAAAGCAAGDTVRIGDAEFDWVPDAPGSGP